MGAVRNLPTLENDSDQNISGEEYTNIIADTVDQHSKRFQEEIISVAGTAISITGTVATDPASFTYFQGKPLFFKAQSDSQGATEINVAGKGLIAVKDMTGSAITTDSWKVGDLVSGIIHSNQLYVSLPVSADETNENSEVIAPHSIFRQLVDVSIVLNDTIDEIFRFENIKGEAGDILQFPLSTISGADDDDTYHHINLYRDGVLISEYIEIHSDYASQNNYTQKVVNKLTYNHLAHALELTDDLTHDYIFKYNGSGNYYLSFKGEISITRYSLPIITDSV